MSQFKVGQQVVAIKDHSRKIFLKGQVFEVLAISNNPCCSREVLHIGFSASKTLCTACNNAYKSSNIWWIHSSLFVPVEEQFQAISFTKVLEQELVSVN
jgi:hypothetical protein